MKRILISAIVAAEFIGRGAAYAQPPALDELMRRVGAYLVRFVDAFSNVVAEEDYEQRFSLGPGRRRLKSDFLLVSYPGKAGLFLMFRDVRDVDGRPVDNQQRITQLFLQPFDSAVNRARDIHLEGSRRHTLPNGRLVDPLQVLTYLQSQYQTQFKISSKGLDRTLGPDVREINLLQNSIPGRISPEAKAWVSEASGEVLKTEWWVGFGPRAQVTTTTFAPDPTLGVRVPVEMRDVMPVGNNEFIGTAKCSNVRRFQVHTESAVGAAPPANPR